ncbi:MAG: flagellar assembly protein FliX [Alphaproteobacteria bacterium]|nr:flagellar assembly protein FliX [Alphaproteobacteria bacterium]
MRIDSKISVTRAAPSRKGRGAKRSGGNFQSQVGAIDSVVSGVGPIAGSDPVHGIDALLVVQQVEDSPKNAERDWTRHWGSDILSRLSQLRDGLLNGSIPLERLERLTKALDARQDINDPDLRQVVDEIELRGRIEIAKLCRDMSRGRK